MSWWEKVVRLAIRPPRAIYELNDLPGPRFTVNGRLFMRHDIQVTNAKGLKLQCGHYRPCDTAETQLPCVVYLHGNSGCQRDCCEVLRPLLSANITVFALDFSGSGLSDGEFITLGINEADDLEAVIAYLRRDVRVSKVALWGRSMGAATAVLYAQRDPSVAALVLDSAFSRFNDLAIELVETYASMNSVWLPRAMIKMVLSFFKRSVKQHTGTDIDGLDVIGAASTSFIPARFGCARGDTFVKCHHTERVHDAYAGDKQLVHFDGDHNGIRPAFFYDASSIFLHNVLQPPDPPAASAGARRYPPPSAATMPPRTPQATAAGLHTPPPPLPTATPATDARAPASGGGGGRGASLTDFNVLTNPHTGFADSRLGDGSATSWLSSEGHRSPPAEKDVTSVVDMGFSRSQALAALRMHTDVELAVNFLLEMNGQQQQQQREAAGGAASAAADHSVRPAARASMEEEARGGAQSPMPSMMSMSSMMDALGPGEMPPDSAAEGRGDGGGAAHAGMPMESLLPAMAHAHDHHLAAAIYMSLQEGQRPGGAAGGQPPSPSDSAPVTAQHMI